MFTKKEIASIDTVYFKVLSKSAFQITLQSKNTLHEWHILSREDRIHGKVIRLCIISHRHNHSDAFHIHGQSKTLADAMKLIKKHDTFQLKGRTL